MNANAPLKILLLENDQSQVESIKRALETRDEPAQLTTVSTLVRARLEIKKSPPDLIIADWKLPDGEGVELLAQSQSRREIPVVIMTNHGNEASAVEAIKAGAMDYIVKNAETLNDMPHIVERAMRQWQILADKARMENELRLRAEAESIWQTVGKTIISNQSADQVLATVIEIIKEKMQVETGTILLWEMDTQSIVFAKLLDADPAPFAALRLKKGEGIVGWVIEQAQSALVPDVSVDERWQSRVDRVTGFITRSILCVPLIAHNQVIGAIELLNKFPGNFNERDQRLLESIAAPLAIAIQNSHLQAQVQTQLQELAVAFAKVEHAKQEWEQTVDVIDDGIWLVDGECRITRANRTIARWLDTTPNDLVNRPCHEAINICQNFSADCPVKQQFKQMIRRGEITLPQFDNHTFQFDTFPRIANGKWIGSVNVLHDVTTELAMQAQLVQAEKLAGIGRLAASLAHEINNPLQALQGCLDLAIANPGNIEKQQRYLDIAKNEVDRLGAIALRMLDFYRPSKGTRSAIDIQSLIAEVLVLSDKRLQHAHVTTQVEWNGAIPVLYGIANQLKQVFLNLVLNATDAMPNGGVIVIRGGVSPDEKFYRIEVADAGMGIAPENIDKIFEPFYTTKSSGTGLGLGISHTIVTSHGGTLTVASELGKGSTFTVALPIQWPDQANADHAGEITL